MDEAAYPYVFLNAAYCKARRDQRAVSRALVIATRVAADVHRKVPVLAVGDSKNGHLLWHAFSARLKSRRLAGAPDYLQLPSDEVLVIFN